MPPAEPRYWTLDPVTREPVPAADVLAWARWFEHSDSVRVLARTGVDGLDVSTVFVGLDMGHGQGPPLLYETMVFGPHGDGGGERRWHTRAEALAGHDALVKELTDAKR